jgi:hypothetical protein
MMSSFSMAIGAHYLTFGNLSLKAAKITSSEYHIRDFKNFVSEMVKIHDPVRVVPATISTGRALF